MNGFNVSEAGHLAPLLLPLSIGAAKTCARFNLKNHAHASIVMLIGNNSAVPGAVVVKQCTDSAGSGATAIVYRYYKQETTPSGDLLAGPTVAATSGLVPASVNNSMYVIEMDGAELADGSPWVEVSFSSGGSACFIAAIAILSGGRQQFQGSPTVLT